MNNYIYSLLQVSFTFAILYSVYFLLFRKLTFFRLNRAVLLGIIPLSILTPFIGNNLIKIPAGNVYLPNFEEFIHVAQNTAAVEATKGFSVSADTFIAILYFTGFSIFAFRLVLSALLLIRLKRKSIVVKDSPFTIIYAPVSQTFSCFNWIFIPGNSAHAVDNTILMHEKRHAKLKHTVDLVLTEFFSVIFWFNPFVYFYRKSLTAVHEFQDDSLIVEGGVKRSNYLLKMLQNLESEARLNGLLNYFNTTSVKQRVKMITKEKSAKFKGFRYLMILPAIALLALSFSESNINPVVQLTGGTSATQGKPELSPIASTDNKGITNQFGIKFKNPVTKEVATHNGIDFKTNEGVSILATSSGRVVKAATEDKWGNLIIIDHGNGYESWYAHLKGFNVKEGETVKKGQIIGFVGNTGVSTGFHLHFEIHENGKPVNPLSYITK